AELAGISTAFPDLAALVSKGIDDIQKSVPALMGDPQYALLNAKRICEMVIDVVVCSELLAQAGLSEQRRALATAFVHRRMPVVEQNAHRILSGDATRIHNYDQILSL